MQVDQGCQVGSSGQDQGFMTMSVGGGVAQHFDPRGTSLGEHCLYSQTCSCINRHQPPIMRLQAVCLARMMIIWVDHPAHCGHAYLALPWIFIGWLIYALSCGHLPCCMQATC